jgi:hypothetical protein
MKTAKPVLRFIVPVLLLCLALPVPGFSAKKGKTIKVGVIQAQSGMYAALKQQPMTSTNWAASMWEGRKCLWNW